MFLFSEDDYRVDESARTVPVLVTKNTRIATQVELMVIPLTVQNASLPLPPNTPADDSHSPPFVGSLRIITSCNINMDIIAIIDLNDFNNTKIKVFFEPDEDAEANEKNIPVFIIDDAINEAQQQVFVVELILVDSVNPATIDLTTRPSSLCRITDNDRKYSA